MPVYVCFARVFCVWVGDTHTHSRIHTKQTHTHTHTHTGRLVVGDALVFSAEGAGDSEEVASASRFLLDLSHSSVASLVQHLKMYKLRAKVVRACVCV